jgi:hypothetical protein
MGEAPESDATAYIASPLASHEQAVSLAVELRLMEFSPHTVVFELRRFHGFTEVEAVGIVREAAAREPSATAAPTWSPTTGPRPGRRWPDLGGVAARPRGTSNPTPALPPRSYRTR